MPLTLCPQQARRYNPLVCIVCDGYAGGLQSEIHASSTETPARAEEGGGPGTTAPSGHVGKRGNRTLAPFTDHPRGNLVHRLPSTRFPDLLHLRASGSGPPCVQ